MKYQEVQVCVLFVLKCLCISVIAQVIQPLICTQEIDVVFLVENSNFIFVDDWNDQRQLVIDIVDQFDSKARFAVVSFNDVGTVEVLLRESEGPNGRAYLQQQVNNMRLVRGHCNVAAALRKVEQDVFKAEAGDRGTVVNVIAILMNGWPTQELNSITPVVQRLQSRGALIVVIAIGPYAYDDNINMLQPVMTLRAGFGNFSEDTAKDAATLICASMHYASDVNNNGNELNEIEGPEETPDLAATLCRESSGNIYQFNVTTIQDSATFTLGSRYRNTVLLIVNVASFSEYTTQNYNELNELIHRVETDDDTHLFEVLAVPSNIFCKQEPGDDNEILECLQYVRPGNGYVPRFSITRKYDVNGKNEHPLYTYLKATCDGPSELLADRNDLFYSPLKRNDIAWNFEKILIDKGGMPFKRYNFMYPPANIYDDIMNLLQMAMP